MLCYPAGLHAQMIGQFAALLRHDVWGWTMGVLNAIYMRGTREAWSPNIRQRCKMGFCCCQAASCSCCLRMRARPYPAVGGTIRPLVPPSPLSSNGRWPWWCPGDVISVNAPDSCTAPSTDRHAFRSLSPLPFTPTQIGRWHSGFARRLLRR